MKRMRSRSSRHAAWPAACLPIFRDGGDGEGDGKDGHGHGHDYDAEGVDDNGDESHMLSTVYLVEASWVGGTILRWHQQPNRHGDQMIYEQFSRDPSRHMICEEFAENLQHYL